MRIPIKKLKGTTTYKSPAQEIETPRDIVDVSKILTVEKNGVERDKKIDELLDLFFLKDNALSLVSGEMKSPNFVKEKKGWLVNALGEAYFNKIIASNIKTFDATVGGSNSDYVTLGAAIEAGKSNILISGDTTETADIPVPVGGFTLTIDKGFTVDMIAYQFTYAQTANVTIRGSGTITYAQTVQNEYVFANDSYSDAILDIADITIDNNSVSSPGGSNITGLLSILLANNIRVELPDSQVSGIYISNYRSRVSNLHLIGSGTDCSGGLNALAGTATNIYIEGTWSQIHDAIYVGVGGQVSNLIFDLPSTDASIEVNGQLVNLKTVNTGAVNMKINANSYLSNIDISAGSLWVNGPAAGENTALITNFRLNAIPINLSTWKHAQMSNSVLNTATIDFTADDNLFQNVFFDGVITVSGDRNRFINCIFIAGVIISGDNNVIGSGSRAGVDGGAGAITITVNSGATGNIIDGVHTDAAIVDNGTSTVLGDNVVY